MKFNNPVMTYLNIDKSVRFFYVIKWRLLMWGETAYFIGGNQNEIRGG